MSPRKKKPTFPWPEYQRRRFGHVLPFRVSSGRKSARTTSSSIAAWIGIVTSAFLLATFSSGGLFPTISLPVIGNRTEVARSFAACGSFRRDNCVVDGDTFQFGGEKIRIADIDAPETHPSRCEHEAELGAAATSRLAELLSEGPFVLRTQGRDEDQYGRKLRIVAREGRSLGAILVREGLAREWTGRREPWCA